MRQKSERRNLITVHLHIFSLGSTLHESEKIVEFWILITMTCHKIIHVDNSSTKLVSILPKKILIRLFVLNEQKDLVFRGQLLKVLVKPFVCCEYFIA